MRRITRVLFASIIISAILVGNTAQVHAEYKGLSIETDGFLQSSAIQTVQTNLSGYSPYGNGLIKIPYSSYVGLFKGPKVYDCNNQLCWDETKWVEGGGFDEVRYAAENPDVAAVVGNSHSALWDHFKNQGINEGRIAHFKAVPQDGVIICKYQNRVVESLNIALCSCNHGMSDTEKVIAVNNEMCQRFDYDINQPYGTMALYGQGICNDYADIFKDAMIFLGIPCTKIARHDHAWNQVYIDGCWKTVDVTWDDGANNKYLLIDVHPKDM